MDSDYIVFHENVLDEEISIQFDATIQQTAALLGLIAMFEQFGLDDVTLLDSVYAQIFEQVMSYGSVIGADDDN